MKLYKEKKFLAIQIKKILEIFPTCISFALYPEKGLLKSGIWVFLPKFLTFLVKFNKI
jgi:hypothetical protein